MEKEGWQLAENTVRNCLKQVVRTTKSSHKGPLPYSIKINEPQVRVKLTYIRRDILFLVFSRSTPISYLIQNSSS